MPDVFDEVLDDIGADFEANAPGLANVTVRQINADTGATEDETDNVPALKRVRDVASQSSGPVKVGYEACRFVMRVSSVGFTPSARDQIEETDGTVWDVDDSPGSVRIIGQGQLVAVNVNLSREDVVA